LIQQHSGDQIPPRRVEQAANIMTQHPGAGKLVVKAVVLRPAHKFTPKPRFVAGLKIVVQIIFKSLASLRNFVQITYLFTKLERTTSLKFLPQKSEFLL
jgi:hypothetical protein